MLDHLFSESRSISNLAHVCPPRSLITTRTCVEGLHPLTKLRINLVCDCRDTNQQHTEIKIGLTVVQGMEYSDLQKPRFLHQHRSGIPRPTPINTVEGCGWGFFGADRRGRAETDHQIIEKLRQMAATMFAAHRNGHQQGLPFRRDYTTSRSPLRLSDRGLRQRSRSHDCGQALLRAGA
jgi:hypothetical protein